MGTKKFNINDFDSIESLGKFIYEKGELLDLDKEYPGFKNHDDVVKFQEIHHMKFKIKNCSLEESVKTMMSIRKWFYFSTKKKDPISIDFNHLYCMHTFEDQQKIKKCINIKENAKLFSIEIFTFYEENKTLNITLGLTTSTNDQYIEMMNNRKYVNRKIRSYIDNIADYTHAVYDLKY